MRIFNVDQESEAGYQAYKAMTKTDSPVFQAIEKELDKWIDGRTDYEEMYFGDEAVYTKKGAIIQAIDQAIEVMEEYKLKWIALNDNRLDLWAAFE